MMTPAGVEGSSGADYALGITLPPGVFCFRSEDDAFSKCKKTLENPSVETQEMSLNGSKLNDFPY